MHATEPTDTLDPLELRRVFGRFATGVTVMTTRTPDGTRLGVTANSFNTVSLTPPIVLWSLSAQSPSLAGFRAAGRFVVNVLALEQLTLSQRFSRPAPEQAPDKFAGVTYTDGLHGQPVLAGCSASIECRVLGDQIVGDHVLFLGQVERYAHQPNAPLLFCGGQYQQGVGLAAAPGEPVYRHATKGRP